MDYRISEFVKWFEQFDDGIVKDSGDGVIIQIETFDTYGKRYKLYRTKHEDFQWFFEHDIIKKE